MDKDKDKMAGIPAADERDPKPVDKVNSDSTYADVASEDETAAADALTAEDSGKVSGGQPGTEGMGTRFQYLGSILSSKYHRNISAESNYSGMRIATILLADYCGCRLELIHNPVAGLIDNNDITILVICYELIL